MKIKRTIKTGTMYRMVSDGVRADRIDEEKRTASLSFSSEEPVERWFGKEILDHDPASVNLDFLNSGSAPLLKDHDRATQTGVIESATVTGKRGRAVVRFGRGEAGTTELDDVVDGIRSNVSVGYQVHRMELVSSDEKEGDVYRVVDWTPLEVSIVSIPADASVGVGRESEREFETVIYEEREPEIMATNDDTTEEREKFDQKAALKQVREAEVARVREINALGKTHGFSDEAAEAVETGTPLEDFRSMVLSGLAKRGENAVADKDVGKPLGLTNKEAKRFSLLRLINALSSPTEPGAQRAAEFEFDVCRQYVEMVGSRGEGFRVPPDALLQRDMTVGTDADGGYLVGTDHRAQDFIDALRNKMMTIQAGAFVLDGLVGDVKIPRLSAGATAYWVAESGAITESKQTMAQVALAPKTVGAMTDISRKLLIQSSPAADSLVQNDLAAVVAIALDLAALHGSGSSNQPTGIASTSGVGSVAGGTNGLAPTYAHVLELESDVAVGNAEMGAIAYMTNPPVRKKLKQVFTNSTYGEIPLWDSRGGSPGVGDMNGYPAYCTNQVSSALTKGSSSGVCSAIFYGNWADLIIALWTGIDLIVDPYTGSSAGTVRVVALQDADVGVRNAASFSVMLDALTT